jgi:hypothetical protein
VVSRQIQSGQPAEEEAAGFLLDGVFLQQIKNAEAAGQGKSGVADEDRDNMGDQPPAFKQLGVLGHRLGHLVCGDHDDRNQRGCKDTQDFQFVSIVKSEENGGNGPAGDRQGFMEVVYREIAGTYAAGHQRNRMQAESGHH